MLSKQAKNLTELQNIVTDVSANPLLLVISCYKLSNYC